MARDQRSKPPENDLALWQKVTADIKPLKRRAAVGERTPKPAASAPPASLEPALERKTAPPVPALPPAPPAPALPALKPGTTAGLDRRTAQRLRRGQLDIAGKLDLHGLTQSAAHRALRQFVEEAAHDGKRCVLVVTGKGQGRSGERETGVLRRMVPRWLNEAALRALIVGVESAQGRHGGEGALYVLLKRKRG